MRNVDPNTLPLPDLFTTLNPEEDLHALLTLARIEDLDGPGDITTILTTAVDRGATRSTSANVVAVAPGVIAGLAVLPPLLKAFHIDLDCTHSITDGTAVLPGATIATLVGPLPDILAVERTLLNLVGHLSGIATLTARYVEQTAGTNARILDTRKTTPGHRGLEKYAVRCGGGYCHRIGLYDAVLIKDNHIAALPAGLRNPALIEQLTDARTVLAPAFIEIEVDSLDQLDTILSWPAGTVDIVLLDNMTTDQLVDAVARRNERNPSLQLEASGGVNLDTVGTIARTGVDRISVGALTHSAPTLDIRLDLISH